MRVLLVYPNAKKEIIGWGDKGAIAEPIALEYIGAVAKSEGHDVKLLDLRFHNDNLESTLVDFKPDVVGVTGYSMHVLRALEVCKIAKSLVPSCVTVAGGHHATLEPVDYFEPQMDFIVIREGTLPFRALLQSLSNADEAPLIPSVWTRRDGKFEFGGEATPFDINAIPVPDRTLAQADRAGYYIDWMRPIALLRTTVGCPYRCSFCALWRIMDGQYYKRDVDQVVEELAGLQEKYVFFVDDEPFVNTRRMKMMAECIERSGVEKEYFSYCRIDSMLKNMDLMRQWHSVGLRRLFIGVETIFDHELEHYNKRQQRDQIVRAIEAAKEAGISLFCNFIIHPEYGDEEFDEIIRFIREYDVDYPSFTVWTPIPGTEQDYENVIERQPNGRPNWDYFDLQHAVIQTRMPKEDFVKRYDGLYRVFADKFLASDSPIMVEHQKLVDGIKEDPNIMIALKALGAGQRRAPG